MENNFCGLMIDRPSYNDEILRADDEYQQELQDKEFKLDMSKYPNIREFAMSYYSGQWCPLYALQCTGYATSSFLNELPARIQNELANWEISNDPDEDYWLDICQSALSEAQSIDQKTLEPWI